MRINDYELVLVLRTDIKEKAKTEIKKLITDSKAKIKTEESLGERDFCYPIKKEKKGIYLVLGFSFEAEKIKELDKALRMKEEVLRFLVIRK